MYTKNMIISAIFALSCFCQLALAWPTFYLYTVYDYEKPVIVTAKNITRTNFDYSKKTVVLIHGFGDNNRITILNKVKDELLKHEEVNIILVDWEKGAASPDYFSASSNTRVVASKLADFLDNSFIDTSSRGHCVGHSLGAHICGFTSKIQRFARISGLDPAGPFFKGKDASERLDKSDADYVDIIHTDSFYGIQDRLGHKDFYPNGGGFQNGCNILDLTIGKRSATENESNHTYENDLESTRLITLNNDARFDPVALVACSHLRVMNFFAESIRGQCRFLAVKCENYDKFKTRKCNCESSTCVRMGYNSDEFEAEGAFYLDTNKVEPFCMY